MSGNYHCNPKEQLLVEYALSDRKLFTKIYHILDSKYFDPPLNNVVEFVVNYFKNYHNIPTPDIIYAETDIDLATHQLDDGEFEYAYEELETHCQNEAMRHAILSSVDHLEKNAMESIFEEVRQALMVRADNNLGTEQFEDPFGRLTRMQEKLDERSIGIDKLDNVIGNVRRGELGIFAASSGGGKSLALGNIALAMASQQDKPNALILSVELNEELITKRLDSMITGISTGDVFGNVTEVVNILQQEQSNYGSIRVKRMPSGATPSTIRTYLMEYHMEFGFYPDVVCLDYIDILKPDNPKLLGDNKFNIDEHLTFGVRDIMAEYDIFGFTCVQLNRDAVDKTEINYGMIAGGISKVNASDFTVALYATQEDIDNWILNVQQLKVRNTAKTTNTVQLYLNPNTLLMTSYMPTAPTQKSNPLGGGNNKPTSGASALKESLKNI